MAKMKERKYILEDFSRDPISGRMLKNKALDDKMFEWLGKAVVVPDPKGFILVDFTGPPGASTGVYYSLAFQLLKWEYFLQKADEWIEVSPVHAQYYQLTMKQKEELEAKIKSGLASAAQSVADLELLLHDKRKYLEMLHYLGYASKTENGEEEIDFSADEAEKKRQEKEKRIDNHSLKAMFIDQVDAHTGEGISMRSIVQRWPTLISDFMKLSDEDLDPDKVRVKLDVSRAEAVILVTKNKLFLEWKRLFLPEVVNRYKRIMELVRSRKKSVDEYKEWLKPVVARHKMIEEGLSSPGRREIMKTLFLTPVGHAMSFSEIVLWAWKDFTSPEIYRISSETTAKHKLPVAGYDDWTKRNLIFNQDHGLIVKYPWITDDWVRKQIPEFYTSGWLVPQKYYYSLFVISFRRTNYRSVTGAELEDGIFEVNFIAVSQNAMLTKLLELKAKQEDFNRYIDELLGIPHPMHGTLPKMKKERANPVAGALGRMNMGLQLFKRGPYERDFDDRITKYYLQPMMGLRYAPIVNFIKQKIGYGV